MSLNQNPLNILVVEDNETDFFLFNEYLKKTGLPTSNVLHASRLKEALVLLESNNPDLIFLDLALPDSDGMDSFTSINAVASQISIIVLSGLSDKQIALNTILLGAQDYLVKGSFDETLLAKSIEYSIERKKNLRNAVENYERYNTLIKATNDTVWDWDLRTDEVVWNEGINQIFGYSLKDLTTTNEWNLKNIHTEDRKGVEDNIRSCIDNSLEQWNEEYRYACADGSYRFVYDRGFILLDEHKKAYRMIGVMIDITERKRLQEEIIRSQVERQKLISSITIQTQEKERREIGRELHDNINQILATAKLYVNVALKEEEIEKELLYKSLEYILKAIDEIRSISKSLIMGSMTEIVLEEAISELIENMRVKNTLLLKLTIHDHEIENMTAEKKLTVYRIVQEQINNIMRHSEATEAEIVLECSDDIFFMVIKDNGIGADPHQKNNGIGLHNISTRLEMQNGKMEVITSPGMGYILKVQMSLC